MKKLIMILMMIGVLFAETEFAEPKPSLDNPRQFVFPITAGDDESINHVLSSANNVLKFYGPEKTELVIVAYSKGLRALLKSEKEIAVRVQALQTYDVEFIACGNTMRTKKVKESDLLEDVEVVTAGIVELIERQKKGWVYIRP